MLPVCDRLPCWHYSEGLCALVHINDARCVVLPLVRVTQDFAFAGALLAVAVGCCVYPTRSLTVEKAKDTAAQSNRQS